MVLTLVTSIIAVVVVAYATLDLHARYKAYRLRQKREPWTVIIPH